MAKTIISSQVLPRLKRVGAAIFFDEAAAQNRMARLCESSGTHQSYRSPSSEVNFDNDLRDLSDLVNSFIERDCTIQDDDDSGGGSGQRKTCSRAHHHHHRNDQRGPLSETKDMLENLLLHKHTNHSDDHRDDDDDDDNVRQSIRAETELACHKLAEMSSSFQGEGSFKFKHALMSHLRDRGFDAGLCKSQWEKSAKHPAGDYEYVDVKVGANRYIVEVFLKVEFIIARPTRNYAALLDVFPRVFVGNPEELKQIVRLMCGAVRESMKRNEMRVAPWRSNRYVQAKWLGPYERTINSVPSRMASSSLSTTQSNHEAFAPTCRSFEFEVLASERVYSGHCRDDFASKLVGLKVGYLTAAFKGNDLDVHL